MAALWGNGAQPGQFPLEQWFYEMPPCTRWWTAATVVTSVLVQCNILNPLQLFYSFRAVYVKSQVRLSDPS
jgi:Derlin-2/3